jgi:hypothetical protein
VLDVALALMVRVESPLAKDASYDVDVLGPLGKVRVMNEPLEVDDSGIVTVFELK